MRFIIKANDDLNEENVINHCEKSLARYKVPHKIYFISEMPKSPVGKILRRELRKIKK